MVTPIRHEGEARKVLRNRLLREQAQVAIVKDGAIRELRMDLAKIVRTAAKGDLWSAAAHARAITEIDAAVRRYGERLSAITRAARHIEAAHGIRDFLHLSNVEAALHTGGLVQRKDLAVSNLLPLAKDAIARRDARAPNPAIGVEGRLRAYTKALSSKAAGASEPPAVKELVKDLTARVAERAEHETERLLVTELTAAHTAGGYAAYDVIGLDHAIAMQWDATLDARTCSACARLHGVVVRGDDKFKSSLFGDVDGPPLHPYCRCSVTPVLGAAVATSARA